MPSPGLRLLLAVAVLCPLVIPAAGAGDAPAVVWRHAAEGWGEPAVDDEAVYFLTRGHEVVALQAATGHVRWRVATGGSGDAPLGAAIRVVDSLIIAADGAIIALRREDGRPQWRFAPIGDAPGPYLGPASGGRVLVGSVVGRLYALHVESGRLEWTARPAGRQPVLVFSPAVAGGRVFATFTARSDRPAGGITAFDAEGRRLWHRKLPSGVGAAGPPVVVNDVVVAAGSDGTLHAWDVRSGRPVWRAPGLEARARRPVALDLRALATTGDHVVAGSTTGWLVAYDGRTGAEAWHYVPPADMAVLRLRADARTVYAPFTDDSLHAVEAGTGKLRWRAGGVGLRVEWPPALQAGRVFAAGVDTLVAWDPSSPARTDSTATRP